MPDYIFNTTALSNFAAVNRVDLPAGQYRERAFTTLEVSDELRRGLKAGYDHLAAAQQALQTMNPDGWVQIFNPGVGGGTPMAGQIG
jgi:predicted nucleic acid-binding protein